MLQQYNYKHKNKVVLCLTDTSLYIYVTDQLHEVLSKIPSCTVEIFLEEEDSCGDHGLGR